MISARDFATLPPELMTHHADLLKALASTKDPRGEWPGDRYLKAYAPEEVGKIMIGALHPNVQGRIFRYLWREALISRGVPALGKAHLASGLVGYFAQADFILEFNWSEWQSLTPRQQVALVDHELEHCCPDLERDVPALAPHDVEEFDVIVRRWGLWRPNLERFGRTVRDASQISLFDPSETVGAQ